jgi:hypothetical protein
VYGTEASFPTSLGFSVMILLHEKDAKLDATQRRTNELINVQQTREKSFNKSQLHQDKIKKDFVKNTKEDDFKVGDLVLKWDARNEDNGKHGKLDHIWLGPFKIVAYHGNNAYLIHEHNGYLVGGGLVNWKVYQVLYLLNQFSPFPFHCI